MELRAALEEANLPTLLLVLAQLTGDVGEEVARRGEAGREHRAQQRLCPIHGDEEA
jgi:hypothetical protein